MLLLNRHHRAPPTTVIRGSSNVVPPEPERTVLVAPGHRASFFAGYSDVPTGNQKCPLARDIEVTPPDDFKHFTLAFGGTPCGGRITVSPVIPGKPFVA